MGLISDLTPLNIVDQKELWEATAPKYDYNPQFVYKREFDRETLYKYGYPDEGLVKLAKKVLEELPSNFFEEQIKSVPPFLDRDQVVFMTQKWIADLGLPKLIVGFNAGQVNRVMLSKNRLYFRWPLEIDGRQLERILEHEITGHYQRSCNHLNNFGVLPKNLNLQRRVTEEGLAQYLADNLYGENSGFSLALGALKYYLADVAQTKSFAEVFQAAYGYLHDVERAWSFTMRAKRGLEDTSQGGGFTKDIVYFAGYLEVDEWIKKHPNDWERIFYGKLSLAEIEEFT
jgi:hypothetical protein